MTLKSAPPRPHLFSYKFHKYDNYDKAPYIVFSYSQSINHTGKLLCQTINSPLPTWQPEAYWAEGVFEI